MTDIELEILKRLSAQKDRQLVNISSLLLKYYPLEDKHNAILFESQARKVGFVLKSLIDSNFAYFPNNYSVGTGNAKDGYVWIDQQGVFAKITRIGEGYLEERARKLSEKRLRKSLIETNTSIQEVNRSAIKLNQETIPRFNKTQKNLTLINIFVAIVIAIFTAIQVFKSNSSDKAIHEEMNELRERVKALEIKK